MSESRRVEYIALSKLEGATSNPKLHADNEIKASMERFGFVETPVIDERTGRLVAGHGRRDALRSLKATGKGAPAGVRVERDDWYIPVERGWSSRDDAEASAYLVSSNRTTELGGWDEAALATMLSDVRDTGAGLEGVGFTNQELDKMLAAIAQPKPGNTDPDDAPEPEEESYVKPGELWHLGAHRILCGDSTDEDDVRRLMGGERAGLMNTDPPYGVAYANDERPNPGVANDMELTDEKLQEFLEKAFRCAVSSALREEAAWYMWHAHLTQGYFAAAAAAANVVLHSQIIWVKPVLLLGRGQYHWKHEPCFMGWVKGHQPPDYGEGHGERTQTTVWEIAGVSQKERKEFNHSTPKPVALFEIPIIKHLLLNEIAYEPFSGSGPQIIAAERTGRRCFAMELEPRYVQVAIERWQNFTGRKATLDGAPVVRKPRPPAEPKAAPTMSLVPAVSDQRKPEAPPSAHEIDTDSLPF